MVTRKELVDEFNRHVDLTTGEVFRVVRSQSDLKGYCDGEGDFPPSIVDSSNYEPLDKLVLRLMKGDTSVVSGVPVYEVGPDVSPEEAIANFDVTRREGFDMADAHIIKRESMELLEREGLSKEGKGSPGKKTDKKDKEPKEKDQKVTPKASGEPDLPDSGKSAPPVAEV